MKEKTVLVDIEMQIQLLNDDKGMRGNQKRKRVD